jgi:hypothetical protein
MKLYMDPETGLLTAEPRRGLMELTGYTPGFTCPAVVCCTVHGRYEPVGTVRLPDPRQGGTEAMAALARTAAAATSGSRADYLRRRRAADAACSAGTFAAPDPQAASGYQAVLLAQAPLSAYRGYCEAVAAACETSWDAILRALADMPVPGEPSRPPAVPAPRPRLSPDGRIGYQGPGIQLPRASAWIALPDGDRWALYDSFVPPRPSSLTHLLDDLMAITVASHSTSCAQASEVLEAISRQTAHLRPEPGVLHRPLAGTGWQAWCREYSQALIRASADIGWQVAAALEALSEM